MQQIHVAAGAIENENGGILVTRRPDHVHQGGLWEFPGGKLELGETAVEGLRRELHEELGIRVLETRPLIRIHHDYGDRHVLLDVHRVRAFLGEPQGREGQPLAWVDPQDMDPRTFPAADRPIITALRLPALHLITGEDPRDANAFLGRLQGALDAGVRLVQLRAHDLTDEAYARLAEKSFELCDRYRARLLLNRGPELAAGLPGHGLHLTAARLAGLSERPVGRTRLIGASCHGADDLLRAELLGLDYALLSPVKATASHPNARPMGWDHFAELVDRAALPVYALGGLITEDLDEAIEHGAQGIAAIHGLWP